MDNNQRSSADHIIEHLKAIDVDGETMEYIINEVGMTSQMLRQLMMDASDLEINNILEERDSFHDKGSNDHLNYKYEVGIDIEDEGTMTLGVFVSVEEANKFIDKFLEKNPSATLFIDTCTDDFLNNK